MPLDRLIFTPGQVPDYASMGFKAASLAPDLQAKFNAGQKAAQDQQMAQLKYQQEKQKADLFAAIAPELKEYKLAQLRAQMAAMNGMAVDPYARGSNAFVRSPFPTAGVSGAAGAGVGATPAPGTGASAGAAVDPATGTVFPAVIPAAGVQSMDINNPNGVRLFGPQGAFQGFGIPQPDPSGADRAGDAGYYGFDDSADYPA